MVRGVVALGFFVLAVGVLFGAGMMIEEEPAGPVTTVSLPSDARETLDRRYTASTERAWCLYGRIDGRTVVVEHVIWDSAAEGEKTNVEFDCRRDVQRPAGTAYLGHVHSHPPDSAARPSAIDRGTNYVTSVTVMGIYNGDELNVFRGEDVTAALQNPDVGGGSGGPPELRITTR